jgi:hypothetical protein
MQLRALSDGVEWTLARAEAHFVAHVLSAILDNYREAEDQQGDAADRWSGRAAIRDSGYDGEEESLWMEERQRYRSEHAQQLDRWKQHLGAAHEDEDLLAWFMSHEEIGVFLITANDHRMFLASQYNLGEMDMEAHLHEVEDDGRRMALLQVHLLAQMMDMLLPHAPL